MNKEKMFCYQCEETANCSGCTMRGVCGKTSDVANLQDLLIHTLKGISFYYSRLRKIGYSDEKINNFVTLGLFATITNANFDRKYFLQKIKEAVALRDLLKKQLEVKENLPQTLPDSAVWNNTDYDAKATNVGILSVANEDIRSLKWTLIYGIKGMAAYIYHANMLGYKDEEITNFMIDSLAVLDTTEDMNILLGLVLKCGEVGTKTMMLLDKANTETLGNPEPVKVPLAPGKNPGILVSGHDLHDLREILEQTKDTGVDVYTHGEMLPAHGYPALKKYKNLIGNYGSSWWHQAVDFEKFNGPIVLTTNCLVPPNDTYKERLYVTGAVGFAGLKKVPESNGKKDFSQIIELAKKSKAPEKMEDGFVMTGFGHNAILSNAEKILDLIKRGKLKRFIVMSGCDGRRKDREYYTKFAQELPKDTIILTSGCAKYRYNKLDLGDIEGIPRVIDAGQCNDTYSLIVVALKLKEVLGLKDINDLPISYNIAWYEQKAALVLLAALHCGIKNIVLGPKLPAFLSKNVLNVIIDKFAVRPNTIVSEDMPAMLGHSPEPPRIDQCDLSKLNYGMYVVSASHGGKVNGLIVNTAFQITAVPPVVAVSVSKKSLTHELIESSGAFSVSILKQDTPMKFIGDFGFKTGKEFDKFRVTKFKTGITGSPIVLENALGYFECKLSKSVDVGTHNIYVGEIVSTKTIDMDKPLSYAYYHEVKSGKSPDTCPLFFVEQEKPHVVTDSKGGLPKYKCVVCGYIYDPVLGDPDSGIAPGTAFEDIPDDWYCPMCGVGKDQFERI